MNDAPTVRPTSTDITVLLDRSGSMYGRLTETITGFNRFLSEQRSLPGRAVLTLVKFDHEYSPVWNCITLGSVPDLNPSLYDPRGDTALYDAIGMAIEAAKARLDRLPIVDVPDKVIFAILTDGMDNRSHQFNREQVFRLIATRQLLDDWIFLFLGADLDAVRVATDLGIRADHALGYRSDGRGISDAFRALSQSVQEVRLLTGPGRFSDPSPPTGPESFDDLDLSEDF